MKYLLLFLVTFFADIAVATAQPEHAHFLTSAAAGASTDSAAAAPTGLGHWTDVSYAKTGSLHVIATGIDGATATVTLLQSDRDDPTGGTPPTALFTVTLSAAGEYFVPVDTNKLTGRWAKVVYTHGNNTTGTIDVYGVFKP